MAPRRGAARGAARVARANADLQPGELQRTIKLVTEQNIIDKPPQAEGFPMRKWSVKVLLLDKDKKEHPANCFTKVIYHLHPSFAEPDQTFTQPPFTCENEGWGEFEMQIDLYYTDKSGKITIPHDLNFQQNHYENEHTVTFKNPSQNLQNLLRETGPLPSDEDRRNRKPETGKLRKKPYDVERMADALVKLDEDDLLQVIQMIHDHKSDETYIQNNLDGEMLPSLLENAPGRRAKRRAPVSPSSSSSRRRPLPNKKNNVLTMHGSIEAGEFSVDLYTLPENLGKMIWDYLVKNNLIEP